jgi:Ni/Co efflux regulator RcnB
MKQFPIFLSTMMATAALLCTPAIAKDHGDKDMEKAQKRADKEDRKADKEELKADKHGRDVRPGAYFVEQDRVYVQRYYTGHYGGQKGCPPGLAKKNNGCVPPGQAKWEVGQPLPREVQVYAVPQPVLTYLPAAPAGYRYQRVGGDLVLVRITDRVIIDIMLNLF